jgi:hypothetical protein
MHQGTSRNRRKYYVRSNFVFRVHMAIRDGPFQASKELTAREKNTIYKREYRKSRTTEQKTKDAEVHKVRQRQLAKKLRDDAVHDPEAAKKLAEKRMKNRARMQKSRDAKMDNNQSMMVPDEDVDDDQEIETEDVAEGAAESEDLAEGEAEGELEQETQQAQRGRSFWEII